MTTLLTTDDGKSNSADAIYEQRTIDKIICTILCRGDFAKQKLESKPVSFFQLFRFATTHDRLLVTVGMFLAVVTGIGQPMICLISGQLTNILLLTKVYERSDTFWNRAYVYVYIFALVGVSMVILTIVQYLCLKNASLNIAFTLRGEYIKSLLRQDAEWFDKQKCGALTAQLNENINKIKDGIGDKIGTILRGLAMFLTCMIIGFIYEWRITLAMFTLGPLSAVLLSIMARQVERASVRQMNADNSAAAVVEESVMNVKTVAACNGQETMIKRYASALQFARIFSLKIYAWAGLFDGLFFLIMYIFFAIGLCYGAYLYQIRVIANPGYVFIVVNAILFGSYYLGMLSPQLMAILHARVAAAIIYNMIDRKPSIDSSSTEGITLCNVKGLVKFENVKISYSKNKERPVLNGVSWTAKPGDVTAIVGHSGCGKSTSIGLLTRLYNCDSGTVLIDGIDIRKFNISVLRNIVGVVQQEPVLFNGTVKENIRLGNLDLSESEIVDACKIANAHDFIEKLAEGYNTTIGANGVQLSGGQKQRLAIARTVVRNPKILLLDEATSALDAESEITVQNALKKVSVGRTTIVIAHRLSTLRDSNQIIVLNKGQVAEVGTHKELCSKENGIYATLVKSQQFVNEKPIQGESPAEELPSELFHRSIDQQLLTNDRRLSVARNSIMSNRIMPRMSIIEELPMKIASELHTKQKEQRLNGLLQLYINCRGNYWKLLMATFTSVLRGMELPAYVILFNFVFKAFAQTDGEAMMRGMFFNGLLYCALGIACLITISIATFLFGWTAECVVDSVRLRALRKVLYQDLAYFDVPDRSPAVIATCITANAPNMKAALDSRMMQIVNNTTAIFELVIIALVLNWPIGLLGAVNFMILTMMQAFVAHQMQRLNEHVLKTDLTGQLAIEIVEQVRTIQLITREAHFHRMYVQKLQELLSEQKKSGPYEAVLFALTTSFMYFSDMISYALGIALIYYGYSSPNEVFTAAVAITTGGWALLMVAGCLNTFILASPASDSLFRIINASGNTTNNDSGSCQKIVGKVQFHKVHFSYPTRQQYGILNGLNLTANEGQMVAVVGPSGSGKSTVISLLERFYKFNSGELKVDGNSIIEISLHHLRENMALVGQEPVLFSGTIAENILLGTTGKTMNDVREACRVANAIDFIEASPQGYNTEVGERGTQLSGGQKQRIAIARALVRNPKILLLDEATSALDSDSEKAVQQALDLARSGRTCITVAHRLSSIQYADQICFIENGKVVEQGTHRELLELNGKYANLIRKQDLRS